jgi:hypothetical protein
MKQIMTRIKEISARTAQMQTKRNKSSVPIRHVILKQAGKFFTKRTQNSTKKMKFTLALLVLFTLKLLLTIKNRFPKTSFHQKLLRSQSKINQFTNQSNQLKKPLPFKRKTNSRTSKTGTNA